MVSVGVRICFTCVHYNVFVARYWNHLDTEIIENLLKINKYRKASQQLKYMCGLFIFEAQSQYYSE
jgi:hypothetical protein